MHLVTGIQNEKGYLIKVHVPGHRYPESKGLFDKSRGQNQADFLKLTKQYLKNKCGNVKNARHVSFRSQDYTGNKAKKKQPRVLDLPPPRIHIARFLGVSSSSGFTLMK